MAMGDDRPKEHDAYRPPTGPDTPEADRPRGGVVPIEKMPLPVLNMVWTGATLMLFIFLVYLMYAIRGPLDSPAKGPSYKDQVEKLRQQHEGEKKLTMEPAAIDKAKDVYRIPVAEAERLLVNEAAANKGQRKKFRPIPEEGAAPAAPK